MHNICEVNYGARRDRGDYGFEGDIVKRRARVNYPAAEHYTIFILAEIRQDISVLVVLASTSKMAWNIQ